MRPIRLNVRLWRFRLSKGLKRGTDWDWQAENRPTREFIDTEALLAKL
jgi:hypothetical protein